MSVPNSPSPSDYGIDDMNYNDEVSSESLTLGHSNNVYLGGNDVSSAGGRGGNGVSLGPNPFASLMNNHGQPSYATDLDGAATPPLDSRSATPRMASHGNVGGGSGIAGNGSFSSPGTSSNNHNHLMMPHNHHRHGGAAQQMTSISPLAAGLGNGPALPVALGDLLPPPQQSPTAAAATAASAPAPSSLPPLAAVPSFTTTFASTNNVIVRQPSPSSYNAAGNNNNLLSSFGGGGGSSGSSDAILSPTGAGTTDGIMEGAALHTPASRPSATGGLSHPPPLPMGMPSSGTNVGGSSTDSLGAALNSGSVSQTASNANTMRRNSQQSPRYGSQNDMLIAYANTQLTMHAGLVANGVNSHAPPAETRSLLTAPRSLNGANGSGTVSPQSGHKPLLSSIASNTAALKSIHSASTDALNQQQSSNNNQVQSSSSVASSYCPAPEASTLPQSFGGGPSPLSNTARYGGGQSLLLNAKRGNAAAAGSSSPSPSTSHPAPAPTSTTTTANAGDEKAAVVTNNSTDNSAPSVAQQQDDEARRERDRAMMVGASSDNTAANRLRDYAAAVAEQQKQQQTATTTTTTSTADNDELTVPHATTSINHAQFGTVGGNNNNNSDNNSFVSNVSSLSRSNVPPPPSSPTPSYGRTAAAAAPMTPTLSAMMPDECVPIGVMMDFVASTSGANSPAAASRSPTLGAKKTAVVGSSSPSLKGAAAPPVLNNNSISGPEMGVMEINGKKVHVVYAPPRLDLPSPAQKPAAKVIVERSTAVSSSAATTTTAANGENNKPRDLSVIVSSSGGDKNNKNEKEPTSTTTIIDKKKDPIPSDEDDGGFKIAPWKFYLACGVLMTDAIGTSMLYSYVGLLVAHVEPSLTAASSGYVAGILVGVFQAAQVISMPIWGRFSDIVGRKPVMLIALFLSVTASLMFGFATSFIQLLVIRIIHGTVCAGISVGKTYIFEVTTPKTQAKGFGHMNLAWSLGSFIGPSIGGFLYDVNNSPIFSLFLPHMEIFDTFPALGPALALSTYGTVIGLLAKRYLPESRPDCVPLDVAFGWFVDWFKVKFCCAKPPPPEMCDMGTSPMAIEDGSGKKKTPASSPPVSPSLRGINIAPDATPNVNPTVVYSLRLEPTILHVESPRTGHFLDEVPIAIYTPQHEPVQIVYKNDEEVANEQQKLEEQSQQRSGNGSRAPSRRASPSTTVIKMVDKPDGADASATTVVIEEAIVEDEYEGKPHADFHRLIDARNAELNEVALISTKQILTHPLLRYTIPMGMLIACVNVTYNEIWPLYAIAYHSAGGLGMTSTHIGIAGMMNAVVALMVNGVFDKLCKRFKHMTLWTVCNSGIAVAMFLLGCFHYLPSTTACLMAFVPFCIIRTPCSSVLFGLSMMFNANASPKKHIGMVTSIAQSGQALARSITPMLAAPLFAWSVSGSLSEGGSSESAIVDVIASNVTDAVAEMMIDEGGEIHAFPFNHFLVFLVCSCVALLTVYLGKQLPNSVIVIRRK